MAEHGHDTLSAAGYIRIGALAGDSGANVGEALGLKAALLPEPAAPQLNVSQPKLGA